MLSETRKTVDLRNLNRQTVIAGAAAASVAVLGVAGVGVAQAHRDVTVQADGVDLAVSGFYPDVRSALNAAGVEMGEYDVVTPGISDRIANGDEIVISRAQEYHVYGEGDYELKWSAADSLDDVIGEVGTSGSTGAIAVSRGSARAALPVAEVGTSATVTVDGNANDVQLAGGESTEQILEKAGVEVSPIDQVKVSVADGVPTIDVKRSERGFSTSTEEVAFEEQREEDPNLAEGTETVKQEGVVGQRTITTYRQSVGGETVVSEVVSNEVTTKPVAKIVTVGTKKAETETKTETTENSDTSSGVSESTEETSSSVGGDVWAALAQCESGGNPSTNTGNGYYGLYQFSAGTWAAMGGSGLPSDASAAEQTAMAQKLQAASGWGQWPSCSSSLGLR